MLLRFFLVLFLIKRIALIIDANNNLTVNKNNKLTNTFCQVQHKIRSIWTINKKLIKHNR